MLLVVVSRRIAGAVVLDDDLDRLGGGVVLQTVGNLVRALLGDEEVEGDLDYNYNNTVLCGACRMFT